MNVLLINCSPVRNGATAELVNLVQAFLTGKADIRADCIDNYDISSFVKGAEAVIKPPAVSRRTA